MGEVGQDKKKVHMAIWRESYWSIPSWNAAKESRTVLGVNIVVWGSDGGPQGPSWPIHGPWPWVRWVEKRKRFIWVLLVFNYGRKGCIPLRAVTKKNGVFQGFCLLAGMLIEEPWLVRVLFSSYSAIFYFLRIISMQNLYIFAFKN